MTIICDLKTVARAHSVKGNCGKCGVEVFEDLHTLDDAYNVWMGRCPACKALNYLSMNYGLRGYDRAVMKLVLPTAEEIAANDLPADTPTSGACGKPADQHGSPVGEICHRLVEGKPL
jgi:hypothetical protein